MNWNEFLEGEINKPYFQKVKKKVEEERQKYTVYPSSDKVFNAFDLTPFENVKVIILGQDPYINEGQAMGLSFSVPEGIRIPPSLKNIFREIEDDLGIKCIESGDLTRWARQGVFLLNTTLTVRAGESNSHQSFGWDNFTTNVLGSLNRDNNPKVFVLWGANARKLKFIISNPKHLILESAHPSPLSAYRGFFGCKHFSKINTFLLSNGLEPIDWR